MMRAEQPLPSELEGVGIEERLGGPVDLNLQFTAENGHQVPLSSFFHAGKPVLLDLVYYQCPMLCNRVLNGQTAALKELAWTAGQEFEVVTVSINPAETFDLAKHKKEVYLDSYGRSTNGWHFLADYQGNVKRLADQVGFRYRYVAAQEQYAHSAAILILTPDGRVSRYLYGINFKQRDLHLALNEASEGRLGSTIDKVVFYCFHWDPQARSYVLFAQNVMRVGGALVATVLGLFLLTLFRRERHRPTPEDWVAAK